MIKTHIDQYKGKRLHFVGIGGCSMNALAQILNVNGYKITGSDKAQSPFTRHLEQLGINVSIGHDAKNVEGADLLVFSAAIKKDNPERARAAELGIAELERSELLGQISNQYKQVVGVAGCHGKTTITSMLALINRESSLDATVHVGGFVDFMGGGVSIGNGEIFITEACEYVESFMHLSPTMAIINNIDDDHLDYFRDIDHITDTFRNFINLMPPSGVLFACVDDERTANLVKSIDGYKIITYGLIDGHYRAQNIKSSSIETTFDLFKGTENLGRLVLHVPGLHNVINALAASACALELGVNFDALSRALEKYVLTRRRFEYYGDVNGAKIYHDYAHHPNEIRACLQGARSVTQNKMYVVFQCNSYTRAKTLFCQNVDCFKEADQVLVVDIFPGREIDTGAVHARDMVNAIAHEGTDAKYIATFEQIKDYLHKILKPGDLVVTLGSGDVYIQSRKLL